MTVSKLSVVRSPSVMISELLMEMSEKIYLVKAKTTKSRAGRRGTEIKGEGIHSTTAVTQLSVGNTKSKPQSYQLLSALPIVKLV